MTILNEARQMFAAGRMAEAVAYVECAAEDGDTDSLMALANWRFFGIYVPRDIELGRTHLERAAALGSVEAMRSHATLVGNGTYGTADPAAAEALLKPIAAKDPFAALQLNFRLSIPDAVHAAARPRRSLSDSPGIELVSGLLIPEECRYLMTLASERLQPSTIIDPRTGARRPDPVRTSFGASFGPLEEDIIVHAINRRIALVSGTDTACGEPLYILRYAPGQEYRPHIDALPGVINQRRTTVIVYLSDDYEGGQTVFTAPGISVRGQQGDALIFQNVDDNGVVDQRSRHAGEAVTSGEKWIATRWIRSAPYHPWKNFDT